MIKLTDEGPWLTDKIFIPVGFDGFAISNSVLTPASEDAFKVDCPKICLLQSQRIGLGKHILHELLAPFKCSKQNFLMFLGGSFWYKPQFADLGDLDILIIPDRRQPALVTYDSRSENTSIDLSQIIEQSFHEIRVSVPDLRDIRIHLHILTEPPEQDEIQKKFRCAMPISLVGALREEELEFYLLFSKDPKLKQNYTRRALERMGYSVL